MTDQYPGAPTPPPAPQTPPPPPPGPPVTPPGPYVAPPGPPVDMSGRPPAVSDTSKILAAIGYPIAIVAIIALFLEPYKNEKFVKFHAVQAIALALAETVLAIAISILSVVPFLGILIAAVGGLASFALFIYSIFLAVKAYGGGYIEIPVLYGIIKQYIGE